MTTNNVADLSANAGVIAPGRSTPFIVPGTGSSPQGGGKESDPRPSLTRTDRPIGEPGFTVYTGYRCSKALGPADLIAQVRTLNPNATIFCHADSLADFGGGDDLAPLFGVSRGELFVRNPTNGATTK